MQPSLLHQAERKAPAPLALAKTTATTNILNAKNGAYQSGIETVTSMQVNPKKRKRSEFEAIPVAEVELAPTQTKGRKKYKGK